MINKGLLTSKTPERETPQKLFDEYDKIYKFTLDPASTNENAKTKKHYTKEEDGLKQDRTGEIVRLNPPYGKEISKRIEKARKDFIKGNNHLKKTTIIMLLPARTDAKRFHEYILNKAKIIFIKGRLKFSNAKNSAPFPSMVCIYDKKF